MRFGWAGAIDMEYRMAVSDQPIGNKHAMAVKINSLSAHIRGGVSLSGLQQLPHTVLKFWSEHVVGIIAEACIAQGCVRGVIASFSAPAAERFQPEITDSGGGERYLHGFAIEMRQAAGRGEGAHVNERPDGMTIQDGQEIIK